MKEKVFFFICSHREQRQRNEEKCRRKKSQVCISIPAVAKERRREEEGGPINRLIRLFVRTSVPIYCTVAWQEEKGREKGGRENSGGQNTSHPLSKSMLNTALYSSSCMHYVHSCKIFLVNTEFLLHTVAWQ